MKNGPSICGCTYDGVWSLGQWCATSLCLKSLGLRSASGPFDWMMGRGRRIGDYVGLVTGGFAGVFLKDGMRKLRDCPAEGMEHWEDCAHGLELRHEFRMGETFDDNYARFRARLDRRGARLLEDLRSGGRRLFVHWLGEGRYPQDEVVSAAHRLRAAFPGTQIDLLVLETDRFAAGVRYEEPEPGVVVAVGDFYDQTRYDAVLGNRDLAMSVFRRIRMRGRWRNLLWLRVDSLRRRISRRREGRK